MEKISDKEALTYLGGSKGSNIGNVIGIIISAIGSFIIGIYNGWNSTSSSSSCIIK